MLETNYLFYAEYLKTKSLNNKSILISKTNNSYLIGPIINKNFDEVSFYKRIKSNSIYSTNIYKRMFRRKCIYLINKYLKDIKNNEVIEIYKNGDFVIHKIIKVPGETNEKE